MIIKKRISEYLYKKYNQSFSQCGEDMILAHLIPKQKGFFIDVGAYHPYKFSNTFSFYKKGWRGVNIDASDESIKLFDKMRGHDINIHTAISDKNEILTYYKLDEGTSMNTFDKTNLHRLGINININCEVKMEAKRLDYVLGKIKEIPEIDFLTIDVEGFELKVLNSNNWEQYRPKIILVESFEPFAVVNMNDKEIIDFLNNKGYDIISKSPNSLFFGRNDLKYTPTNSIIIE
jgi:FkbM family methyltransferase